MAQMTIGAKLIAALITGGSVAGLAVTSGTVPWPGVFEPKPAAIASTPEQVSDTASAPEVDVASEEIVAPKVQEAVVVEQSSDVVEEVVTEIETALVMPQAPVLSGPPSVDGEPAIEAKPLVVPSFDLLRVEPDGSVVIVGNAGANATVEAITGSRTLGTATAAANGDFVIIFNEQLPPGDYNIVLRADDNQGTAATSLQTAIVSIPEQGANGVLALVEEPGVPSRLISAGEGTATPLADATDLAQAEDAVETEPAIKADEAPEETVASLETDVEAEAPKSAAPLSDVRIEAVEIDGRTVFVAGQAEPGARLRVYANDLLLGETVANPDGSFLVQVNRELSVGDYMVRADLLSANGAEVIMRAAVPFVRQPGEKLAAVAVPPSVDLPTDPPAISGESEPAPVVSPTEYQATIETASADSGGIETQLQQPLTSADSSVIIRRGDTLWQISRRVYGRGVKYTTIYNANVDQIRDPNRIWPGQIFAVPENAEPDEVPATTVN